MGGYVAKFSKEIRNPIARFFKNINIFCIALLLEALISNGIIFSPCLLLNGHNLLKNKQVVEGCLVHILNDKDVNKLWATEYNKGLEIKV